MSDYTKASEENEADHKTLALKIDGADETITEEVGGEVEADAAPHPIYDRQIEIAFGRNKSDKYWRNERSTFQAFGEKYLTDFQRGLKDGACMLSGAVVGSQRLKTSMTRNSLVLLDHDTGETMDEIEAAIAPHGLFAVLWHTHSHLKTMSDVGEGGLVNFLKKAPEFSSQGYTAPDTDETVLIEQLRAYFRSEKGFKDDIVDSMYAARRVHEDGGVRYTTDHAPLHRLRSLFVLDEDFSFTAGVQKDRLTEWTERYGGFCINTLGVKYDSTCADPSRLMYLPRIARDADESLYEIRVIDGRALTLNDMPRHNTRARSNEANAFASAARELGVAASNAERKTYVTKNVLKFAAQGAASFAAAEHARVADPDSIRGERGTKLTRRCPNDDNHSNPGDPNDQGFWIENAQDRDGSGFMMSCSHATCKAMSDGDRLFYFDLYCQENGIEDALELKDWCDDWKEGLSTVNDLPPGFVRKNGMIYSGASDEDDEDDERGVVVCSDFRCSARARDAESGAWSRILEFNNSEGVEKAVSVADAELQGDGVDVRARLADAGLFISTNPKARREFMRLLNTVRSEGLVRHSTKTGFMGENNEVFLLPADADGFGAAVFAPDASDELKAEQHVWTKRPTGFTPKSKGTLEGWQEGVNIAFKSNAHDEIAAPHVAEGILRGVAGPLIALADRDPMGMHYVGESSSGKTTEGMAQVSPWSDVVEGRGLMFGARGTVNANETAFAAMNHTTGVINDLENSDDPTLARELPYAAASRGGKRRMNKNADARPVASWAGFAFTMNSERSPQQLMGKHAAQTSGGLVRAPVLNTSNVPKMDKATIDKMTDAFKDNFGHAGAQLVSGLYKRGWHRDCAVLKEAVADYHKEHTGDLEPAQRRSLEVYAYARVAGDVMVEDGILGSHVTKNDVAAVVRWALAQAKASPEFQKMNASKNGARQLIEFLNTSGQVYEVGRDCEGRATPLAWKDGVAGVAYVPQSSFGKFEGITASEADIVAELKVKGLLDKRGDRWLHQHVPGLGSVSHYRVKLEAANKHYGGGDYVPPSAEEKAFAAAKRGESATAKPDPLEVVAARVRSPWRSVGSGMEVGEPKALAQWVKARRRQR